MTRRRHPNVINIDETEPMSRNKGRFGSTTRRLAQAAGAKALGFNWMELPPGKVAFPYHFHTGVEEGVYILSGTGKMRIGKDTVEVRAGDYVAFPAGPDYAHQLMNDGDQPLQYLTFSNQNTTDICGYPDSKKFAFAGTPDPSKWPNGMWVRMMVREGPSVDYYDGEDTGE